MSFVDVLPVEPVIADDARVRPLAHGRRDRGERRVRVVGDERGRRAARERVLDEVGAAADGDEQVAFADPPRVDLHAGDGVGPRPRDQPARAARCRPSSSGITPSTSRATCAVVERDAAAGELHLGVGALAGDHDDVAGPRVRERRARSPRGGRARPRAVPSATSAAIAAGSSERGLSVVTIARSASAPRRRAPSAAASRGRGRRRRRRRRSAGRRARARRAARSRASRACARSRRSPRTAGPPRPTRSGPGTPSSASMPARIASSSIPSSRAAQTAPSAFARLKRPRSFRSMSPRSSSGVNVRASGSVCGEPPPPLVADVHDGALGLRRRAPLRREVLVHRPVEVEVVLRQVREHEHREARARRAVPSRRRSTSPPSRTSGRPRRASRGTAAAGRSPPAC